MNDPYIIKKPVNEHSYRELVGILLENITAPQRQKILERLTKINQRELDKQKPEIKYDPKFDPSLLKKYSLHDKLTMFNNIKSQVQNNEHNDYFSQ